MWNMADYYGIQLTTKRKTENTQIFYNSEALHIVKIS
jgi:hypothetical protein